jgi:hypothetical protein
MKIINNITKVAPTELCKIPLTVFYKQYAPAEPRKRFYAKFLFILLLGCGISFNIAAQKDSTLEKGKVVHDNYFWSHYFFMNQEYSSFIDEKLNVPYTAYHTGFRPLLRDQFQVLPDTAWHSNVKHSLLYRKVYLENLFIIRDSASKLYATIDPIFNFQGGVDPDSGKKFVQNTRGILFQGNIGTKFAFSSIFWENQADFPYYVKQFINENYVIPGYGRPKAFGVSEYDFSMSEAYLSFSFSRHFNLQGGYGKNFIGDGYRSLLLSDNSFAYPYLRFTTTFWHIQYTNLYALLQNPFTSYATTVGNIEGVIQRKAASFQYLSWNLVPRLQWGLFQGLIWQGADQYNHMAFNANYFDPVIGVNSAVYGLSNTNNIVLGSTLKYEFTKNIMGYGQFVADDFPQNGQWSSFYNRTGYQLGLKYYNKFGDFQVEYNQVRPYTYAAADSLQSYTNYDQALGDPLGANFKELIGIINLRYHHFSLHLQGNYALEGLDSVNTNYGNNLFIPDGRATLTSTNVTLLQGIRSTLMYMDAHISYLMNPRTNMNFTVGVSRRTLTNSLGGQPASTLFYVGFRTSIENMYLDF